MTVVVNAQSVAESLVSLPFGIRTSDPVTVFESATATGSALPSTSVCANEPMNARSIAPSYERASTHSLSTVS